jgi:hypothetical protein
MTLLLFVLVAAASFLAGSRWASRRFADAVEGMSHALDQLEETAYADTPRIRPARLDKIEGER